MMTTALIGLGSNLGDRERHLDDAVAALSQTQGVDLRRVSDYRATAPVGGPGGQGAFLNAVARLETSLDPETLLKRLHAIEAESGRVRDVVWGERTLDLDLLLHGDHVVQTPALTVPHPRMALRRFVLAPMAEVAPAAIDPLTGRTAADLLANLDRRPSRLAFATDQPIPLYEPLADALAAWPVEREDDRWLVSPRHGIAGRLAPTFVVALRSTPSPPGVPVLRVVDLESETTMNAILTACQATRIG